MLSVGGKVRSNETKQTRSAMEGQGQVRIMRLHFIFLFMLVNNRTNLNLSLLSDLFFFYMQLIASVLFFTPSIPANSSESSYYTRNFLFFF